MADPGQFTLNSDGQFFLNADGSWAVLNGAGECPACCGGGSVSGCSKTQYDFTRTWVCERNNLQYTQDMLNAWSDNFTWEEGPFGQNGLVGPPCANYARYTSPTWVVQATTQTSPAVFGGPNQGFMAANRFMQYWLWNGGGPVIQVDASISFNRGYFATFSPPVQPVGEFNVYAFGTISVGDAVLSLGRVQAVSIGGGQSNLWLDGANTGVPFQQNTIVRIQATGSFVRLTSSTVKFIRTGTYTIGGVNYPSSYESVALGWPDTSPTPFPDLCLCQPRIITGPSYGLVMDDLSIAVINPFEPV